MGVGVGTAVHSDRSTEYCRERNISTVEFEIGTVPPTGRCEKKEKGRSCFNYLLTYPMPNKHMGFSEQDIGR